MFDCLRLLPEIAFEQLGAVAIPGTDLSHHFVQAEDKRHNCLASLSETHSGKKIQLHIPFDCYQGAIRRKEPPPFSEVKNFCKMWTQLGSLVNCSLAGMESRNLKVIACGQCSIPESPVGEVSCTWRNGACAAFQSLKELAITKSTNLS